MPELRAASMKGGRGGSRSRWGRPSACPRPKSAGGCTAARRSSRSTIAPESCIGPACLETRTTVGKKDTVTWAPQGRTISGKRPAGGEHEGPAGQQQRRHRAAPSPIPSSPAATQGQLHSPSTLTPSFQAPGTTLSNLDLVTLAVQSLGGAADRVDTEDVAKVASRLAPGRLSWRKYPDQINLELVRVYLSDAKKAKNGALVIGSGRSGWMLTQTGKARAAALASAGPLPAFTHPRADTAATQRERAERAWVLGHPALEVLKRAGASALSPRDLESLFRVDEYILGAVRERRVARVLNAVADDLELIALLGPAAERVRILRER